MTLSGIRADQQVFKQIAIDHDGDREATSEAYHESVAYVVKDMVEAG